MKKIRLIELFAGYGSQAMALKRLGVNFEHYKVVEFDKYAIKSYNAVHNTNFDTIDIRDFTGEDLGIVELDKYDYLITYSFPCTDLSLAGKMRGMGQDSGTRSGLLWEVARLLKESKNLPQYLLMENVTQVHCNKNIKDFSNWISFLKSLGYINKWADLNARDYGVPQNRDRCFMISYLNKELKFAFPSAIPLYKSSINILEKNVDNKYFLTQDKLERFLKLIIATQDNEKIIIKANTKLGYYELLNGGVVDLSYPKSKARRGRVINNGLISSTITASGAYDKLVIYKSIIQGIRIRKLTPLECFRFMDVYDEDAAKMLSVNTEAQCYKQAGNSIVVSVLEAIFKNMFLGGSDKTKSQIDIFDIL